MLKELSNTGAAWYRDASCCTEEDKVASQVARETKAGS
ncbi:unnamed protein product [Amoebophrya sp. A25]|nr:unnamed protein product [Amoebophrya sp. A25]|eukprot:GSA25T00006934001.1